MKIIQSQHQQSTNIFSSPQINRGVTEITQPTELTQTTQIATKPRKPEAFTGSRSCNPTLWLQQMKRYLVAINVEPAVFGLFNGRKWRPKNTVITEYTGTKTSTPINGNYVLQVTKNKFINGNRSIDTASYANDCRSINQKDKQCRGNNAKFTHDRRHNKVNLITTKSILPHQEVFVSYGRGYWKKMNETHTNINSIQSMKLTEKPKYTIRYVSQINRINQ